MLKTLLFLVAFIVTATHISAQVCSGDFIFTTQQEVDDFLVENPTCTSIEGNLQVYSFPSPDPVVNVDALLNITSVSGNVEITADGWIDGSPSSLSLSGLGSITTIGEQLSIVDELDNPHIDTLAGLGSLTSIHKLFLSSCNGISSISDLNGLTTAEDIEIVRCDNLPLIDIFPNIVSMTGNFIYRPNDTSAQDFSGFDALISINNIIIQSLDDKASVGNFNGFVNLLFCNEIIFDECVFANFEGFDSLQIAASLYLDVECETDFADFYSLNMVNNISVYTGGPGVESPDFSALLVVPQDIYVIGQFSSVGFSSLQTIGGSFIMSGDFENSYEGMFSTINATELESIGGDFALTFAMADNVSFLDNLMYIAGTIIITDCPNLGDCSVQAFCDAIAIDPGMVFVMNNATGCNTTAEIAAMCFTSYVTGNVFADLDCDGAYNNADVIMPGIVIYDQDEMPTGSTYWDGSFLAGLADSSVITLIAAAPTGFTTDSYTFTTTDQDDVYEGYDFAMCPVVDLHNLAVSITPYNTARPGMNALYHIHVQNMGSSSENGTVVFDFTDMPGATVANAYGGTEAGSTVSWDVSSLGVFETLTLEVLMAISPDVTLGTVFHPTASVNIAPGTITDIDPTNNTFTLDQTVVNSYDPNDKTASRIAVEFGEVEDGNPMELDYVIRFQNTGTAEALEVRVEDVIEMDLDLGTLQMIAVSHPYELSFDEDRKATWLFENINLPDSASDEIGSHGYIHFRINTKMNLGLADIIENNAAIYFDFNDPVITNVATTIFYECPIPVAIDGPENVCEGEDFNLVTSGDYASYIWSIESTEVGILPELLITDAVAGDFSIHLLAETEYCMSETSYVVTVNETPATPVITQAGNTLTASGTGNFTWTMNGESFADGESSVEISESGIYAVTTEEFGCTSDVASGAFTYTGVDEMNSLINFNILPNPMHDQATLSISGMNSGTMQLRITDATGRLVMSKVIISDKLILTSEGMQPGVYFISVYENEKDVQSVQRLVIQ